MRIKAPAIPRRKNERGASLVEYALLLALIAAVLTIAIGSLGDSVDDSFNRSADKIAEASAAGA